MTNTSYKWYLNWAVAGNTSSESSVNKGVCGHLARIGSLKNFRQKLLKISEKTSENQLTNECQMWYLMKARSKERLIRKEVKVQTFQIKMRFERTSKKSEKTSENRLTNECQMWYPMKARLKEQLIGKEVEAQASQMKNEVRKELQKNLKKLLKIAWQTKINVI